METSDISASIISSAQLLGYLFQKTMVALAAKSVISTSC